MSFLVDLHDTAALFALRRGQRLCSCAPAMARNDDSLCFFCGVAVSFDFISREAARQGIAIQTVASRSRRGHVMKHERRRDDAPNVLRASRGLYEQSNDLPSLL